MPGLRRAAPNGFVLDLTRQLAEQYDAIPLPKVAAVVKAAVATATGPDGEWAVKPQGMPTLIDVIEHLAREDLDEMVAGVTPSPGAGGPRGEGRSGPRRGAASRG